MTLGIGRDPGRDAPPVLEASEHDPDAITPPVAALVVFHDLPVRLPTNDADRYSASSHSAFGRSPSCAATGVVADLSGRQIEPHRAALRISDSVQLPVQATFPPTDLSAAPLFCMQTASRALCFQRGRIDHVRVWISVPGGQADHDPGKDHVIAPTFPTFAERFGRPVFLWRIAPSPTIAVDGDNGAQHVRIVNPRTAKAFAKDGAGALSARLSARTARS